MSFVKYMHLEKFGNDAVEGIELGKVYIFPKIDGTNASVWRELRGDHGAECLCAGSRTREISPEKDNAGFAVWVQCTDWYNAFSDFFDKYPNFRLFGEWLVPHSFTGYRQDAWKKFYIFDVFNDETQQYLPYDVYKSLLDEFKLEYIPPLAIVKNGDYEAFLKYLNENRYLCPDGGDPGEGIVLKNYDYYNKFGVQVWAKIIRQEFKELHHKAMGAPEVNSSMMNEERVLTKALTCALVDKTLDKIKLDKGGWTSKYIPELFGRLYHDIIVEELWDSLKEINYGTVNFKTLKALMINQIKQMKPELF